MSPTYSIVVPVYNSDLSLVELTERIGRVFDGELSEPYEIIFIDDGSPSRTTWETLTNLASANNAVRALQLTKNFGQGSAVLCGMGAARGQWVITMDDDLQHRPEDIPLLVKCCRHDVVIARFGDKKCNSFKRIASRFKNSLDVRLLGLPRGLRSTSFKMLKRRVVNDILKISTTRPFTIAQILAVTSDIVNVDVTHDSRRFGASSYNLRKLLSLFSNLVLNNSPLLFRAMWILGAFLAAFAACFGLAVIIKQLLGGAGVSGSVSAAVIVFTPTGMVIFCIGVAGEYLVRVLETGEKRPAYLIRKIVESDHEEERRE